MGKKHTSRDKRAKPREAMTPKAEDFSFLSFAFASGDRHVILIDSRDLRVPELLVFPRILFVIRRLIYGQNM